MSGCRLTQGTVQNQIQAITVRGTLYAPITYIPDQTAQFPGMVQTFQ
jgi:hypothetical protein